MSAKLQLLKRRRAILRARDDLIAFTKLTNPVPDAPDDVDQSLYVDAKHHRVIAAALEQVAARKIPRLIITLPPRHGKTTLASHAFPAWVAGKFPNDSMILSTYNEKFSWDFGRKVRDIMQMPQYGQVFPETVLKDNAAAVDRLAIDGGGVLFFTGRGSSITGRGGNILLIDDPLKDRNEADSPAIREKLWTWFTQVLGTRLMTKDGAIVIIMTRWHEDDLVGRLTDPHNPCYSVEEAKRWKIIDLPAIAGDKDVLGRKKGEALWPERFDLEYLENVRRTDMRGFQALYQGRPSPEDGAFFKAEYIRTYIRMSDLPARDSLRYYAASDHAVSLEQGRDKTCLMVVGVDDHDQIWVMPDVFWTRASTDVVVEAMIALMEKYKPQTWWAEKGHISKSIGPFLRKRMLERRVFCAIDEVTPVGDKQQRAQSIHARMAMGKVVMPQFPRWYADAHDQLLKFPQGVHDDFVDTLAYIGLGLTKQRPKKLLAPASNAPAFGTYGWIKNDTKQRERDQRYARTSGGW